MKKDSKSDKDLWRLYGIAQLTSDLCSPNTGNIRKSGEYMQTVSVMNFKKRKSKKSRQKLVIFYPEITACYLNISKKSWDFARELRIKSGIDSSRKEEVYFKSTSQCLDFLELIIESIIFSYTALDSFANSCIPDHYEYTNKKMLRIIFIQTQKLNAGLILMKSLIKFFLGFFK